MFMYHRVPPTFHSLMCSLDPSVPAALSLSFSFDFLFFLFFFHFRLDIIAVCLHGVSHCFVGEFVFV